MSTKKLVIILIVIAAVVALGYWKTQERRAEVAPPTSGDAMKNVPAVGGTMQEIPAATGNVDETVDALLSAVEQENKIVLDESNEADLINGEVDALDQYGQSYVPSEF